MDEYERKQSGAAWTDIIHVMRVVVAADNEVQGEVERGFCVDARGERMGQLSCAPVGSKLQLRVQPGVQVA